LNKQVLFGEGVAADTMIPPGSIIQVDVKALPHDPDKAKSLLAEAGVTGLKVDIKAENDGYTVQVAEGLAANLKDVGIDATVVPLESALWAEEVHTNRNFTITCTFRTSTIDAHPRTSLFFRSDGIGNYSNFNDPEVDKLLDQGAQELDVTKRTSIYNKVWETVVPWAGIIPINVEPQVIAMGKNVNGYRVFPEKNAFFESVWLST